MGKFFFKTFFFVLSVLIVAIIIQPLIDKGLRRSNYSSNYEGWNDIFESKINADLLIQGSSRAVNHFSPKHLDSILQINCFNVGIIGYPFEMQYYRFFTYLKHNKKPKYIIQATDYFTLNKREDLFEYEQFIPYLNEPLIQEAVRPYNFFDFRDFYIPFYKYIHKIDLPLYGLISNFGYTTSSTYNYKGFRPIRMRWDDSFLKFKNEHPNGYVSEIDTLTLRLFDVFVKYCNSNKIKLIFVNSPGYYQAIKMLKNKNSIDSIYKWYSNKYNIPFLDYSEDSICLDSLNFYNSQHLNVTGVDKFNEKLGVDLIKVIPPGSL
jgi:hypothetical protein